ncbi:MAG TPA: ribonuclease III [Candidatus Eisenbacteria bacterium]|nr:ribonuclease III [Candidatus Eisenbacteria bacterium]
MAREDDDRLMERLGYVFRDPLLLDRALTHSSSVPELRTARGEDIAFTGSEVQDNERLEFLGDAVLELLTSEYLLHAFPEWTEGQLSKSRARIVNAHSLEIAARRLDLGDHLRLGRGEEKTGGRDKPALLADAFEAVVAAMYLDGGLPPVRDLLTRIVFEQALEDGERISESDRKSALQELLQARGDQPAEYRLAGESGPDHQKTFRVEVWIKGEFMSSAEGTTKKEAEQKAARRALEKLHLTSANLGEEVGPNAG